jgi:AraC-like DNA-binding protein
MKLHIKGMMTRRCIFALESLLLQHGIGFIQTKLGQVTLKEAITPDQKMRLAASLKEIGLDLVEDRKHLLVEQIKLTLLKTLDDAESRPNMNISELLEKELGYNYTYLSNIFTELEHKTIKQFEIEHHIELVKRLYFEEDLTLTEIAYRLGYSSIGHLSFQFKKITGFNPSEYKKNGMGYTNWARVNMHSDLVENK